MKKINKYTGIPLWAGLLFVIIFMLSIKAIAANNIVVSITTYKDGVPTTLDSLRLNARYYSNATPTVITDISYLMNPTSFIWDTVIVHNVGTDVEILQNYEMWFGNDVLYIDNKERLRLDSVNFTDNISFGGGGAGSGPNTVFIYTVDSSAIPDDTLTGISIFVENLTGTPEASGITNSLGYTTVGLTFDSWRLKAGTNKTTYAFDDTVFTNSNNPDTFSIFGYLNVIPGPVDPSKGKIYGFAKTVLGDPKDSVTVILSLEKTMNATSTSPGGYVVALGVDTVLTDTLGYFEFEVPITSTYNDSTSLYMIQGFLNKLPQFVVGGIIVPDTGNVDITDEINNQ